MSSTVFVALALLFVAAVSASPCTNFVAQANLDSSRLNGAWFGIYADEAAPIRCLKDTVQIASNGHVSADTEFINNANNAKVTRHSNGVPIAGVLSRLSLTYTDSPDSSDEIVALGTDYDHYIIWASCSPSTPQTFSLVVLSKQTTLSAAQLNEVKQTLRLNNIPDTLAPLSQAGC